MRAAATVRPDGVRFAIAAVNLARMGADRGPDLPDMMCSVRPQGRARAVDAEKLACARSVVTKRLALRAAAIRLNVGKTALSGLLRARQEINAAFGG